MDEKGKDDGRGRLESWKAIARHFGRSERTVRRWEANEGLPVRRHPHSGGSSVYAFTRELDAWRDARSVASKAPRPVEEGASLPEVVAVGDSPPPRPWALRLRVATVATVVVAVILAPALYILVRLPADDAIGSMPPPGSASRPFQHDDLALAVSLHGNGQRVAARSVLEEIVTREPDFAVAHAELAWLRFALGDMGGAEEAARRATSLPTDDWRSSQYAKAAHAFVTGDRRGATAALEVLVASDGRSVLFRHRLLETCLRWLPPGDCTEHASALAQLEPGRLGFAFQAARTLAAAGAAPGIVRAHAERLRASLTRTDLLERSELAIDIVLLPARVAWARGEPGRSIQALDHVQAMFGAWPGRARDSLAIAIAEHLLALGRFDAADAWFDRVGSAALRHEAKALGLLARFDLPALERHLSLGAGYQAPFTAILLAMVGDVVRAGELVTATGALASTSAGADIIRGRLMLARGHAGEAASLLREAIASDRATRSRLRLVGADTLSAILDGEGNTLEALEVLEPAVDSAIAAALDGAGAVWLICQSRLARLYRRMGRHRDALQVKDSIARALVHADSEHPLIGPRGG